MSWLNDLQEKHFPGHPETIKGIEEILVMKLHWQKHLDEVPGEKYLGTLDFEFKVKKDASSLPLNMKISSSVFFEGNNFQVAYEMEPNKYFPHGKVFPKHELVVKNDVPLISLFSMMSEDFKKIKEEVDSL